MPKLLVVATPIGNLNDISDRVRDAFSKCDLVACEDTRVTMKLLEYIGIRKPLISCHRHNEEDKAPSIIERMLSEDLTVALCSDAGTPAVSDPGNRLVEAAWDAGIRVEPVSGPSAAMTALSAAGFYAREFAFAGFPPRETKAVGEQLERYRKAGASVIIVYESPHRITEYLEKAASFWPDARVCVSCDLTKMYERLDRGNIRDVIAALKANPNAEKGEYCCVIECPKAESEETESDKTPEETILAFMLSGMDKRQAVEAAAAKGIGKNAAKKALLRIKALADSL